MSEQKSPMAMCPRASTIYFLKSVFSIAFICLACVTARKNNKNSVTALFALIKLFVFLQFEMNGRKRIFDWLW